jgi:uncharacterized protein (DUF1778 family)
LVFAIEYLFAYDVVVVFWYSSWLVSPVGTTSKMKTSEPSCMGRPKKDVEAVSMRIEEDAYELARQAAAIFKESIVVYASRIVRERAQADLLEDAKRRILESEKPEKSAKKVTKQV